MSARAFNGQQGVQGPYGRHDAYRSLDRGGPHDRDGHAAARRQVEARKWFSYTYQILLRTPVQIW